VRRRSRGAATTWGVKDSGSGYRNKDPSRLADRPRLSSDETPGRRVSLQGVAIVAGIATWLLVVWLIGRFHAGEFDM
jgi:hypothetical protein